MYIDHAIHSAELRENFVRLVEEAGVFPVEKKFIDKVYMQFGYDANTCTSATVAKFFYEKAKALMGTETRLVLKNEGIQLAGQLDGAHSSKAIFEMIAKSGKMFIFKFPMNDFFFSFVEKDYEFCRALKIRNDGEFPDGLVYYDKLSMRNSKDSIVTGSISKPYVTSLNRFTKPLSVDFVCSIVKRVQAALTVVHALGYAINDLKPENLFIDSDMIVDIGDFGGAEKVGDPLTEMTPQYIPEDLYDQRVSSPAIDWMCLINSAFDFLGYQTKGTSSQIRAHVAFIAKDIGEELPILLNEILATVKSE